MEDWKDGLPEEFKDHPSLEKYTTEGGLVNVPTELVKGFVNAQKLIGKEKIPVPADGDGDEAWNEVWSRLGRPETAEGYELKLPENMPQEFDGAEEMTKDFKTTAHKLGMLPKQAQGLLDWFMETNGQILQKNVEAGQNFRAESEAGLRKAWGRAYSQNVAEAQNAFEAIAKDMGQEDGEALAKLLEDTQLGDHPLVLKFFNKVGKMLGEDTIGDTKGRGFVLNPEEAQAEIAKIMGDKKNPYWDKTHAEHKIAHDRMRQLHEMAYPEPKT